MKFDFKDITIVPEYLSDINSRSVIDPSTDGYHLPIMVAPMDTVVNDENYQDFIENRFVPCIPRRSDGRIKFYDEFVFTSMSFIDFCSFLDGYLKTGEVGFFKKIHILIDVANGHMKSIGDKVSLFLEKRKSLGKENDHIIMVGNVANPETYKHYAKMGVDYVRVGIGGGSGCLTSANIGVHYPMASLVAECFSIKQESNFTTKIVADGGMKNYDDVIKAIALGADYVMIGGLFNKSLESCGQTSIFKFLYVSNKQAKYLWEKAPFLRKFMYKKFRGMSTKEVQKSWGNPVLKTSEGIVKLNKIEYTLPQWKDNFIDYLRSAMSYTNSHKLNDFRGANYVFITQNSLNRFNK